MGKVPQSLYNTDTETDHSSTSVENLKKKRKPSSILKYTSNAAKKKKCKIHSVSEPDESDQRSRASSRARTGPKKLQGILKNSKREKERYYCRQPPQNWPKEAALQGILKNSKSEKEYYSTSEDEDEPQEVMPTMPPDKFLVGRVPLPPGSKPGRGGGLALLVRKSVKNDQSMQPKQTSSSSKKSSRERSLSRKRSY